MKILKKHANGMQKMIEASWSFDHEGWLTIDFCGHQPVIGKFIFPPEA